MTEKWKKMYNYAKIYFEHHNHLLVKFTFKTTNGYDPDPNGKIKLGAWIFMQAYLYKQNKLSKEEIELLELIGMDFNIKETMAKTI